MPSRVRRDRGIHFPLLVAKRSPCLRRHLSEMMDGINERLRANMKTRGYGDHSQEICALSASSFGAVRQFQSRIEATTYE